MKRSISEIQVDDSDSLLYMKENECASDGSTLCKGKVLQFKKVVSMNSESFLTTNPIVQQY